MKTSFNINSSSHFFHTYKKRVSVILVLSLLFASSLVKAESAESVKPDETAIELLNRMNHALHTLNYNGTLAYLRGNSLSSLRIEHSVVNGVQSERVVRLNEAGNEISRELQGFSLASIPKIRPEMGAVYSFDMGRENRVANIPCRIITARPKDRKRYLQKYCIDATTGMLLDYMLVGKSHKPVEQFMFTSIEINIPEKIIVKEGAQQQVQNEEVIVNNAVSAVSNSKAPLKPGFKQVSSKELDDGWVMEVLPVGFEISQAPSMKPMKEGNDQGGETKHYIISDGLSSLSVFVSPYPENKSVDALKINSGALNVITQKKGNALITAVGEVPEGTLRNIIENLRKK